MRLYSYHRSTTSYRVRSALNLKGLAYELEAVDLTEGAQHTADYKALNPGAGVPTLVLDDGTVLTQSLAILEYLDAVAPEPLLLPQDPIQRAKVQAAAHTVALDIHPINNLRVVQRLKGTHGFSAEAAQAWMCHWMAEGFAALEAQLGDDGPFSFGQTITLADLCLVAQAYNAHRWGLSLDPYPKVQRVEAACLALPEIQAAHPDAPQNAKDS
ncbi:maleylacetoacetate isomerase [Pseudooctadecabacter jejudonensis]|uniref:Maleylpyruvate isomerase n=1 Tax=Pseudooctadecabacter jejudonensis TaxID=1391910 RepID=A0A1Y5TKD1_9RHOB|nr:maleylacetoacetate isomerase [Pseudooctadecabacter jejudonensis]SLN62501.1 Maleylpyruvate isomerase [Pseudooctadecabacter jejudonensis]